MKLELPDDHPLAKAIRAATRPSQSSGIRLILSLDSFDNRGRIGREFTAEIDSWSDTVSPAGHGFECKLTDPAVRDAQIRAMMIWPTMPEMNTETP